MLGLFINARLNDHDIISILKKYLKLVSEQ